METIILIFVCFVAWLYLAKFINDNYQRSRGFSSIFWFILLLGTVSFLFGSSNTNTSSNSGGDNDSCSNYDYEDECRKDSWDSDDNHDSSYSFGGDDE